VHPHCAAKRINHNAVAWIGLRKHASAQVDAGAKADKLNRARMGAALTAGTGSDSPISAGRRQLLRAVCIGRGRSGLRRTNLSSGEYVAAPAAAP
jgi:hypothetical protein